MDKLSDEKFEEIHHKVIVMISEKLNISQQRASDMLELVDGNYEKLIGYVHGKFKKRYEHVKK